ncbi:MAG: hypothetical protein IKZ82_02130, partial [Clostridia bacterium]|nr:hypothetical protein [Clostridia bacterium]
GILNQPLTKVRFCGILHSREPPFNVEVVLQFNYTTWVPFFVDFVLPMHCTRTFNSYVEFIIYPMNRLDAALGE